MSSPECELARIAISAASRWSSSIAPASISATAPNGLTQLRRVTMRSVSPRPRTTLPVASTSTMSPRWTLSSIPLRIWRTRIGGTTRDLLPLRRGADADAPERRRGAAGAGTGGGGPRAGGGGGGAGVTPDPRGRSRRRRGGGGGGGGRRTPPTGGAGRGRGGADARTPPPRAPTPRRHSAEGPVSASQTAAPQTLHVSDHPAVLHKLAILRDEKTEPKK